MLEVADRNPNQVLLVRAPRRKAYLDRWKALPEERFTAYDEPGRYKGAPAKRIHVAETTTAIRAAKGAPVRQVRTLVVREEKRRGEDRWHALMESTAMLKPLLAAFLPVTVKVKALGLMSENVTSPRSSSAKTVELEYSSWMAPLYLPSQGYLRGMRWMPPQMRKRI
jgi:hypothetical protein